MKYQGKIEQKKDLVNKEYVDNLVLANRNISGAWMLQGYPNWSEESTFSFISHTPDKPEGTLILPEENNGRVADKYVDHTKFMVIQIGYNVELSGVAFSYNALITLLPDIYTDLMYDNGVHIIRVVDTLEEGVRKLHINVFDKESQQIRHDLYYLSWQSSKI